MQVGCTRDSARTKPLLKIESQGAPETSGHPHMDKGISPRQHLRQLPLRALALLQPKLRDIQTIHHTEQILIQMNGIHKYYAENFQLVENSDQASSITQLSQEQGVYVPTPSVACIGLN